MFSADSLRKTLYSPDAIDETNRRGYHHSTAYDAVCHSVIVDRPAAVMPKSGYKLSLGCLIGTSAALFGMKIRNHEKWWFGLMGISALYFVSVKSHRVDNGLLGHQSAFYAATLLLVGSLTRLIRHAGSPRHNYTLLATSASLMWYEIGRFRLWSDHASELRNEISPTHSYDLMNDFVPSDLDPSTLQFRSVHAHDNVPISRDALSR